MLWLNDVLSEVWQNRGPFPGIGSVLQYLGCESGTAFQREVLLPLLNKGDNAWEYVKAILEGRRKCEQKQYAKALKQAGERWVAYKEPRRRLLSLLARFELTPQQVERVANPDKRSNCGISASDEQLVANPYLLSEMDQGDGESDLIALETVDRAMRPEGAAARFIDKSRHLRPGRSSPSPWRGRCRAARSGPAGRHSAPICRNHQPHHQTLS